MPRRVVLFLIAAVWAGTGAVACSNNDGTGTQASPQTTAAPAADPDFLAAQVQVRAEDIKFPQRSYQATAGQVTIGYVNEGSIYHTLAIENSEGKGVDGWSRLEVRDRGDVAVGSVNLTAAEYVLYCDVPGHRGNGMEASLVVDDQVEGPSETTDGAPE